MMNLEVLFQSADLTGNSTLRDIAIAHADTTMKNHIRDDGMRLKYISKVSVQWLDVQVAHGTL